jgi:hypothetical protein
VSSNRTRNVSLILVTKHLCKFACFGRSRFSWNVFSSTRNELLTQYPELAEELEEEIKKMEAENAAKQAELEEIQQTLSNKQPALTSDDGSNGGTAFLSKSATLSNGGGVTTHSEASDNEPDIADDFTVSEDISTDGETRDDANADSTGDDYNADQPTSSETTEVASSSEGLSPPKEDFALSHLAIESLRAFLKHAKDDVKRILELVVPVMQPLLTAGDVAWRQIKALFVKARDAYYESASSQQSAEDSDTVTTEDEQPAKASADPEQCEGNSDP